jgi:hypothetical protein
MRRAVFERIQGFDETIETGEDMDLCHRTTAAGYRVVQTSSMVSVHLGEPRTLGAVMRRNRWHGRGARFRYPSGRFSPVLAGTILFAALTLGSVLAAIDGLRTHRWVLLTLLVLPAVVPVVYAARYARSPRRVSHFARLVPIYAAYFIGRASVLPVVVRDYWHRAANGRIQSAKGLEDGRNSQRRGSRQDDHEHS